MATPTSSTTIGPSSPAPTSTLMNEQVHFQQQQHHGHDHHKRQEPHNHQESSQAGCYPYQPAGHEQSNSGLVYAVGPAETDTTSASPTTPKKRQRKATARTKGGGRGKQAGGSSGSGVEESDTGGRIRDGGSSGSNSGGAITWAGIQVIGNDRNNDGATGHTHTHNLHRRHASITTPSPPRSSKAGGNHRSKASEGLLASPVPSFAAPPPPPTLQPQLSPQPIDHIFIADGVGGKKASGKKVPLSCCECRRLKLKCDRTFPCSSCKKRGCAEICPGGALVSGKGTRFILANTEQLHTKIHEMSERIRHLEEALDTLYVSCNCDASWNVVHGQSNVRAEPILTDQLPRSGIGEYPGPMAFYVSTFSAASPTGTSHHPLSSPRSSTCGKLSPSPEREYPRFGTEREDVNECRDPSAVESSLHGRVEKRKRVADDDDDMIKEITGAWGDCEGLGMSSFERPNGERDPRDKQPHPLLHPDLLTIKFTVELYSGASTTIPGVVTGPSTAAASTGNTPQRGHSPLTTSNKKGQQEQSHHVPMQVDAKESEAERERGENQAKDGQHEDGMDVDDDLSRLEARELSPPSDKAQLTSDLIEAEIRRLSYSFPLSDKCSQETNVAMREYIRDKLPSQDEADYLWTQVKRNALWQYNPHPSETFFPNLAHHCYNTSSIEEVCPRRLALLLMILAVGCLVDINRRPADSPDAEMYHHLARASLCEISVMEETNAETITALFYEIWYLLVFSDKKKAAGYAWGLMGLTAKLAQSIGLHRNGGKSKIIPEEVEKRRSLFWELLYLDARLSLSLGRPPSLCINHMDCKRPLYIPDEGCHPSESSHHYQKWKHECYIECLAPALEVISQPSVEYSTVLELDKKIREFQIPQSLREGNLSSTQIIMQKGSLATALEAVLLQLHRTFFTRALSGPEEALNKKHKYAPSVVAVFLSAARMIATLQDLYHREPILTARILGYWSNAFSAAVALCLLVSRAPFTCLSPAALQELERARRLFNMAKDTCPRALQVIPILETMVGKANDIYDRWYHGQEIPTMVLRHTDEPSDQALGGLIRSPDIAPASISMHSPTLSSASSSTYFGSPGPAHRKAVALVPKSPPVPSRASSVEAQQQPTEPGDPAQDSFARSHGSLSQCIVEVHQRAKALYPMRKPCKCSSNAPACPPSHSWSPPPPIAPGPVLPSLSSCEFDCVGYAIGNCVSSRRSFETRSGIHQRLECSTPDPQITKNWVAEQREKELVQKLMESVTGDGEINEQSFRATYSDAGSRSYTTARTGDSGVSLFGDAPLDDRRNTMHIRSESMPPPPLPHSQAQFHPQWEYNPGHSVGAPRPSETFTDKQAHHPLPVSVLAIAGVPPSSTLASYLDYRIPPQPNYDLTDSNEPFTHSRHQQHPQQRRQHQATSGATMGQGAQDYPQPPLSPTPRMSTNFESGALDRGAVWMNWF